VGFERRRCGAAHEFTLRRDDFYRGA